MSIKTIKTLEHRKPKIALKALLFSCVMPIALFSQSSFSYVYQCAKSDTKCVVNFNKDVANDKEYNFEGLTIKPIRYESDKINRDGKKIDKFTEITLRISKSH